MFSALSPKFDLEPLPSMYFVYLFGVNGVRLLLTITGKRLISVLMFFLAFFSCEIIWLGHSLVVFDVVFLVVGLPSIVPTRLGFQDLVLGDLTSMISFIARGRFHDLLILFRLPLPSLFSHLVAAFISSRISGGSSFRHVCFGFSVLASHSPSPQVVSLLLLIPLLVFVLSVTLAFR
ncbi:hypothetical protein F2Q69_00054742 [Brassica cretica]|uniref:Uncharacterized protein n=1 Tax=Brassica cretica TaxID=69181 RepID=A0A8S9MZI0_BRACR|nr:hypothetical protein F2Q69_00054742 [Brassica cretica]